MERQLSFKIMPDRSKLTFELIGRIGYNARPAYLQKLK
ncbi:hypothetical protein NTGM5_350016 [Candidatus Nitrotoga sp. M5]|nr:hypothetical protein NTGM5_350016 [Candidatus Nitrotoga sp. M5]